MIFRLGSANLVKWNDAARGGVGKCTIGWVGGGDGCNENAGIKRVLSVRTDLLPFSE